jgi:hypothetical protein
LLSRCARCGGVESERVAALEALECGADEEPAARVRRSLVSRCGSIATQCR